MLKPPLSMSYQQFQPQYQKSIETISLKFKSF